MKHLFVTFCCVVFALIMYAQQPAPAASGITYGQVITNAGSISADELEQNFRNNKFEGRVTGKVVEVCQEKGCWMKIQKTNGEKLMVKFKDYGFFMPKNIVGKQVVLDGEATIKDVSVKQQKHYALDAGKSKEEIELIKDHKKEIQFVAKGVLVL